MTKRKLGKDFLPPQLSFGLGAGEFSYNFEPLGEILTVSYPRSALQARDYKHNQQTNRFQKRAVTLGKQGSGVSAPAARRPPRDSHILRPIPALAIVGPGLGAEDACYESHTGYDLSSASSDRRPGSKRSREDHRLGQ